MASACEDMTEMRNDMPRPSTLDLLGTELSASLSSSAPLYMQRSSSHQLPIRSRSLSGSMQSSSSHQLPIRSKSLSGSSGDSVSSLLRGVSTAPVYNAGSALSRSLSRCGGMVTSPSFWGGMVLGFAIVAVVVICIIICKKIWDYFTK